MNPTRHEPKTQGQRDQTDATTLKIDLVWKVVVLGIVALAGRLSWRAFEEMVASQKANEATHVATLNLLHSMDTRVSVAEYQLKAYEARLREAETRLNDAYRPSK